LFEEEEDPPQENHTCKPSGGFSETIASICSFLLLVALLLLLVISIKIQINSEKADRTYEEIGECVLEEVKKIFRIWVNIVKLTFKLIAYSPVPATGTGVPSSAAPSTTVVEVAFQHKENIKQVPENVGN